MELLDLLGLVDVPGSGVGEEDPAGALPAPYGETGTADHYCSL
jgi:hypothetical protein